MFKIDKKTVFYGGVVIVAYVVGLLCGRYLFGSRADVSGIRDTINKAREQQLSTASQQQGAIDSISNAQSASGNIAAGVEQLEATARDSAGVLESNRRILADVRKTGQQAKR